MRPQISESREAEDGSETELGRGPRGRRVRRTILPPELCITASVVLILAVGISLSSQAGPEEGGAVGDQGILHHAPVEGVTLAVDGRTAASASRDGTVQVWELGSRRAGQVVARGRAGFSSVAFSPDGRALVVGGLKGEVQVLDPATGSVLAALGGHRLAVRAVAFAPDGASVVSGGDDCAVRVWAIPSGRETHVLHGHARFVQQLAFSPDGRRLATIGIDGEAILWDPASGRLLQRFPTGGPLSAVTFSPDGRRLVLGGTGRILIRDVTTGHSRSFSNDQGRVTALRYLPDGTSLVSSGMDGSITLWEVAPNDLRCRSVRRRHQGGVRTLALSPDGTTLISGGNDDAVRLWGIARTRPAAFVPPPA